MKAFTWWRYSNLLKMRIESPLFAGILSDEDAEAHHTCVTGTAGDFAEGNLVKFYLIVSKVDGTILNARFQAYGASALIGGADAACDLMIGKNYDMATRISADLIDTSLQDKAGISSFPEETYTHLNLILDAILDATSRCTGIPFAANYVATPINQRSDEVREYPGWKSLSLIEKKQILDQVMATEVQPYVELDQGGVNVTKVLDNDEVIIAYTGSCTSCYSSIGSTLSAIAHILQTKVHPDIAVTPDLSSLNLPS